MADLSYLAEYTFRLFYNDLNLLFERISEPSRFKQLYSYFQVQDIHIISDEVTELFTALAKLWYTTGFHARGTERNEMYIEGTDRVQSDDWLLREEREPDACGGY
jgi:hypothetical protein